MKANSFFYRHYLVAGESFTGHAAAALVGGILMILGLALVATVTLLPAGMVMGLLGLLMFGGGVFAHIQSPVKFHDIADSMISLVGAAIAMTFTLAAAAFVLAFGVSVVAALIGWLR